MFYVINCRLNLAPIEGCQILLNTCPNFDRYLQEIGYTDTIIDVRSNRVRSLLGLHDNNITNQVMFRWNFEI